MFDIVTVLRDGSRLGCAAMGLLAGVSIWQTWNHRPLATGGIGLVVGSAGFAASYLAHYRLEDSLPYVAVLVNCVGLVAAAIGVELLVLSIGKGSINLGRRKLDNLRCARIRS
jgi:peptidoglycan/LPS O-acetylase OafA/YrhL